MWARGRAYHTPTAIDLPPLARVRVGDSRREHVYFDLSTRAWIRFERGTLMRSDLYLTLSLRENLEEDARERRATPTKGKRSTWRTDARPREELNEFGAEFSSLIREIGRSYLSRLANTRKSREVALIYFPSTQWRAVGLKTLGHFLLR